MNTVFTHLQIEWYSILGAWCPHTPILSAFCPQMNLLNLPPPPPGKFQATPLAAVPIIISRTATFHNQTKTKSKMCFAFSSNYPLYLNDPDTSQLNSASCNSYPVSLSTMTHTSQTQRTLQPSRHDTPGLHTALK
jgi:hypothetical protein